MVEALHVCGQGVYGKHQYLPLNFALNLKNFKSFFKKVGKGREEFRKSLER